MAKTNSAEILDIATELFRKRGYNASSMADIANESGLLKGSLYSHFDSKEDILFQVLLNLTEQFRSAVLSIAYDDEITSHLRLKNILDIIEDVYIVKKGCVLGVLSMEITNTIPRARKIIYSFFVEWAAAFEYILKEKYGKVKAKALGEDIVVRIEGSIMWMRTSNDPSVFTRTCKEIRLLC